MAFRVIPSNAPAELGGVINLFPLTINTLSPDPSATYPDHLT